MPFEYKKRSANNLKANIYYILKSITDIDLNRFRHSLKYPHPITDWMWVFYLFDSQ
jgi:hypothetical protein